MTLRVASPAPGMMSPAPANPMDNPPHDQGDTEPAQKSGPPFSNGMPHMLPSGAALTAPATLLWASWAAQKRGARRGWASSAALTSSGGPAHTLSPHTALAACTFSTNTATRRHEAQASRDQLVSAKSVEPVRSSQAGYQRASVGRLTDTLRTLAAGARRLL